MNCYMVLAKMELNCYNSSLLNVFKKDEVANDKSLFAATGAGFKKI
jgi:hypothetical protein